MFSSEDYQNEQKNSPYILANANFKKDHAHTKFKQRQLSHGEQLEQQLNCVLIDTNFKKDLAHAKFKQRQLSHGQKLEQQLNFVLLGNQTHVNKIRYTCGRVINNEKTQKFLVFVIILNSIMLGLGTFDFVLSNNALHSAFGTIDFICLCLFTVEMILQIIFRKWQLLRDLWLVFDFFVIAMSWMIESMEIGRAFRILRASRIVVRMHGLRDLVEALVTCVPRIFAVGVLLLLVMYVYGVILTSLFKDLYLEGYLDEDYFSRLDKTVFTLFQMMTMDNWSAIVKQVMVVHIWAWIPFVLFILTTTFLILNLAVGVICNAVSNANMDEIEDRIEQVSSEVGERNDCHIRVLEEKIDALTLLVEKLAKERKPDVTISLSKASSTTSLSIDDSNKSTSNTAPFTNIYRKE